ncbi:ferritin-like domain-containing protein, partial [Pseudomonas protegens]|uniref:ferritin-like domain-containing protein n=1 Tax=Pseudomonas protegens TaxID=380021 RepID=UPI0024A789EE
MSDMHLSDVNTLRERARQHVENGAVTEGYNADREEILRLLNESLATELVCVLRYKRHYFMANGIKASVAASEFLEHATQEAEHADKLAERIVQLGGQRLVEQAQYLLAIGVVALGHGSVFHVLAGPFA